MYIINNMIRGATDFVFGKAAIGRSKELAGIKMISIRLLSAAVMLISFMQLSADEPA